MQRLFCPITPQKRTLHPTDDVPLRELSPFPSLPSHRKNNKLELLQSPTPVHRDLFAQLLATDRKTLPSPQPRYDPMEEEDYDELEQMELQEALMSGEEEGEGDGESEGLEEESDSSGIKKRKRKSTAQIKMLKQELEVEPNWSKEKIVEMSDLTGLSQSQVYKWWWDQKKKTARNDALSKIILKRKQIRKDFVRRPLRPDHDKENLPFEIEDPAATKVKANVDIEHLQDTERKVNKRLVFF